jgi:hypothetical protein
MWPRHVPLVPSGSSDGRTGGGLECGTKIEVGVPRRRLRSTALICRRESVAVKIGSTLLPRLPGGGIDTARDRFCLVSRVTGMPRLPANRAPGWLARATPIAVNAARIGGLYRECGWPDGNLLDEGDSRIGGFTADRRATSGWITIGWPARAAVSASRRWCRPCIRPDSMPWPGHASCSLPGLASTTVRPSASWICVSRPLQVR